VLHESRSTNSKGRFCPRLFFVAVDVQRERQNKSAMSMPARCYAEDLRSIGQALEARDIIDFELKRLADLYVIQAVPEQGASPRSKTRQWLRRLRSRSTHEPIIFHPADVERLSQAGRAKRSKPGQLTNFRTLSNILRTIGAYLDRGELELVELQKRRVSVTLTYRDKAGQKREEVRTISSFYRLFLDLCGKRGKAQ
jgi:hypothetical protein